jgi:hypothetical protein
VLRVWESEVHNNVGKVVRRVAAALQQRMPARPRQGPPRPRRGGIGRQIRRQARRGGAA